MCTSVGHSITTGVTLIFLILVGGCGTSPGNNCSTCALDGGGDALPDTTVIISANFDDGTYGGFNTWEANGDPPQPRIELVDDFTGSGRGKIAKMRYYKEGYGDDNTCFLQPGAHGPPNNEAALHIGSPGRYYEFDFYIPSEVWARAVSDPHFAQKLLYIKESEYYGGNFYFRFVVGVFGTKLSMTSVFSITTDHSQQERVDPEHLDIGLASGQWYNLKVYLQRESAVGVNDGVVSVWVDGVRHYHFTGLRWSHPSWLTQNLPGTNRLAKPEDLYMDVVMIGQQMNTVAPSGPASYDLYRYLDNVKISR